MSLYTRAPHCLGGPQINQSKQSVRQYCKLIGCAGIFYIFYIRYGRSSSLLFRHDGLHSARFCACLHEILHQYCCISL